MINVQRDYLDWQPTDHLSTFFPQKIWKLASHTFICAHYSIGESNLILNSRILHFNLFIIMNLYSKVNWTLYLEMYGIISFFMTHFYSGNIRKLWQIKNYIDYSNVCPIKVILIMTLKVNINEFICASIHEH